MRGHAETRVEVDTKVTNNGGRGNSGRTHAERNLWNLELPKARREPKDLCLGWIKLEPSSPPPHTAGGDDFLLRFVAQLDAEKRPVCCTVIFSRRLSSPLMDRQTYRLNTVVLTTSQCQQV